MTCNCLKTKNVLSMKMEHYINLRKLWLYTRTFCLQIIHGFLTIQIIQRRNLQLCFQETIAKPSDVYLELLKK